MKSMFQKMIRQLHVALAKKELPERIAIYFHEMEGDWMKQLEISLEFFSSLGYHFDHTPESSKKYVEISFDDNYESWHATLPLMRKFSVRSRFYTNTCVFQEQGNCPELAQYRKAIGYSGKDRPLSKTQLREIAAEGHVIGAHSHSHANLAALNANDIRSEMIQNKQILEDIIGKNVCEMAFTYGLPRYFSKEAELICKELGFTRIAHATPGMQYAKIDEGVVHRTGWKKEISLEENIENICIDGRLFVSLTGRSPVG